MVGSFGVDECFKNQEQWEYGELRPAEFTIRFTDQADYLTVYDYARKYSGQMVMETDAEITAIDRTTGEAFGRMLSLTVLDCGNLYRLQNADHGGCRGTG